MMILKDMGVMETILQSTTIQVQQNQVHLPAELLVEMETMRDLETTMDLEAAQALAEVVQEILEHHILLEIVETQIHMDSFREILILAKKLPETTIQAHPIQIQTLTEQPIPTVKVK